MTTIYRDRAEAGAALAEQLAPFVGQEDVIILGLVRGGVPVAAAVAERLGAPLDVLVVRKLGVPWAPEVAFGALGPHGVKVLNEDPLAPVEQADVDEVVRRETAELERRERLYRTGRPPLRLDGRTAVIIDDGLATGATARAAVAVARQLGAARVIAAVPVGAEQAYDLLRREAGEVVCLQRPSEFGAVSRFYEDFHEVSDEEVAAALGTRG